MSRYQEGMTLDEAFDAWAAEQDWKPTALMEEAFQQGWLARRLCDPASTPGPANTIEPPADDAQRELAAALDDTAHELLRTYHEQKAFWERTLAPGGLSVYAARDTSNRPVLAPVLIALAEVQVARARLMEGNRS
jgi:hypothetical protein